MPHAPEHTAAVQTTYIVMQRLHTGPKTPGPMCDPPSFKNVGAGWRGDVWVVKVLKGKRPQGLGSPKIIQVMWHQKGLAAAKRRDSPFRLAYDRAQVIAAELNAGGYPDLRWPLSAMTAAAAPLGRKPPPPAHRCEVKVSLPPLNTPAYKRREFDSRERGYPIHQCGRPWAYTLNGTHMCTEHAQKAACAILLAQGHIRPRA